MQKRGYVEYRYESNSSDGMEVNDFEEIEEVVKLHLFGECFYWKLYRFEAN
jgi:hypothetical protein